MLFGDAHAYGTDFLAGLGFSGIAVALLGRNNPVGIAFAALLFAFLDERAACWTSSRRPNDDRRDHPGRDRAVRRHRLRDRPPLRRAREERRVGRAARPACAEPAGGAA